MNQQKRFNKWAKKYDKSLLQKIIFRDSHSIIIKDMIYKPNMKLNILDIACGTGKLAFRLVRYSKYIKVEGIDFSDKMIRKARINQLKKGTKNTSFKQALASKLPYSDNTFNIVTCSHAFHHFPNQRKVIKEAYRVLKKNGKFMVIDGCRDKFIGQVIFGVIIKNIEGNVYHILEDEIRDIMLDAGFRAIRQRIYGTFIPLLFTVGIK